MGAYFPPGGGHNPYLAMIPRANYTQHYTALVSRADADENGGLSATELGNEITSLQDKQSLIDDAIDAFGELFGGAVKFVLEAIKQQIDLQLEVAERVDNNFSTFDDADTSDGEVTNDDVTALSNVDYNPIDISDRDLGIPVGTPEETSAYAQFLTGADRSSGNGWFPPGADGQVTQGEIDNHMDFLGEAKTYYEAQRDAAPDNQKWLFQVQVDNIQRQINVGQRITDNFDKFDDLVAGDRDGKITGPSLLALAEVDGDASDISATDLA